MVDLARRRDNQAAGLIVPPPVLHDLPPGQGDHCGSRSDDRAAEPRLAEDLGRDRLSCELGRSSACMEISSKITARSASTSSSVINE